MNARQLREKLGAKRTEYQTLWASKPERDFTDDEVKTLQALNVEMSDIGQQLDTAQTLEQAAEQNQKALDDDRTPVGRLPTPQVKARPTTEAKSVRDYLTAQAATFTSLRDRPGTMVIDMPDVDMKTLITLTTINNQVTRRAGIIPMALEERTVGDLMLGGTLDNNAFEYYEETAFTNNAGMVAEGGTKPESAFTWTLRSETMRKIAHNVPMTDEVLDDVSGLQAQVEGRLVFGVQRKEEQQVLSGTGVAPQLLGILNRPGIQTQARGTDPTFDAIYKAMTLIRNVGFAEPTAVVMNPTDWQNIVLTRTTDGVYILGNPAGEAPQRIWGLDVRSTTAMTQGTALVGAFRPYAQLFRRGGITVTMSTEHSTFFSENKVLIQAEERALLAVYRAAAFATVTGLPA